MANNENMDDVKDEVQAEAGVKNAEVVEATKVETAKAEIVADNKTPEKSNKKDKKQDKKKAKKEARQGGFGKKLKETGSELKKVSWPTFGKVMKQTGVVLAVVAVFTVVLFGIDYLLGLLFNLFTSGIK